MSVNLMCITCSVLQLVQAQLEDGEEGEGTRRHSSHHPVHPKQPDRQHVRPRHEGQGRLHLLQAEGAHEGEEEVQRRGLLVGRPARRLRVPLPDATTTAERRRRRGGLRGRRGGRGPS